MWHRRDRSMLTLIYPRKPAERQILLGLKKRGFGAGKYNGFGGKLELKETLEESAVREVLEESCLQIKGVPKDALNWRGCLTYIYDTKTKAMEVNVFDFDTWDGDAEETEEMQPSWFSHEDLPLTNMWADDTYWLQQYLNGELATPFYGRFRFRGHEGDASWDVLEHSVCSLLPASVPRPMTNREAHEGSALLVSTVKFSSPGGSRNCEALPLESFLRYHLLKGFKHILIIVDDPQDEASLAVLRKFPATRVIVRVRGPLLKEEQASSCRSFADLAPLGLGEQVGADVSSRQLLDMELAAALAPRLGCRWLVALDSDELFYTDAQWVVPHFSSLVAEGVQQMTYINHEAVPEVEETVDYFTTTTLFKKHHFSVPLTGPAREGLRFWMDRPHRKQYLLFYDNGKSAVDVSAAVLPGVKPQSQHVWQLPKSCRSCTALADARNLKLEGLKTCTDPCILHFPVCGLSWLLAKYQILGSFSNTWLGKVKLPESFHSDAREALREGKEKLSAMFRAEVLLSDPEEVQRQLACGTCMRIESHAKLLDSSYVPSTTTPSTALQGTPETLGNLQGIEKGWILSKAVAGYL